MKEWLKVPIVSKFHEVVRNTNIKGNVLGIGSSPQKKDVLNLPYFQENQNDLNLTGINISGNFGKFNCFEVIEANAHDIPFSDGHFDMVLCNAMLEHDPEFWETIGEVNRVLKKGGWFIVNTPGYDLIESDVKDATYTYQIHGDDYYRFTKQSFREVIFRGMKDVEVVSVMNPPRILGWGRIK